jgi:hypothetical protein
MIGDKCNLGANKWIADDGSLYGKRGQLLIATDIILEPEATTRRQSDCPRDEQMQVLPLESLHDPSAACTSELSSR